MSSGDFKKICASNPEFNKFIILLNRTYTLPKQGSAKQIFGEIDGKYAITTTYTLADNVVVEATLTEDNVFTMQIAGHDTVNENQFV